MDNNHKQIKAETIEKAFKMLERIISDCIILQNYISQNFIYTKIEDNEKGKN